MVQLHTLVVTVWAEGSPVYVVFVGGRLGAATLAHEVSRATQSVSAISLRVKHDVGFVIFATLRNEHLIKLRCRSCLLGASQRTLRQLKSRVQRVVGRSHFGILLLQVHDLLPQLADLQLQLSVFVVVLALDARLFKHSFIALLLFSDHFDLLLQQIYSLVIHGTEEVLTTLNRVY